MSQTDLQVFFRPQAVAVIGASDTPNRPTTAMYEKVQQWAAAVGADVYPVNPNREMVGDVKCYPTVLDVPADIDVAAILVGEAADVLPGIIAKGVGFAVVFAAGFAEVGARGMIRQAALQRMIAGTGVRILGPNTNLNAFELYRDDLPGRAIALITQSGHQGRPIFQGQDIGIRMGYWAPTGNEADLEFADFASWFADRPEVGAIAAYIEGFKDGTTLRRAAQHAAEQGVPIVCVKVGRTDEGRSMARAHTGHLTGSDAVVDAAFRQFGIVRVSGLDELLDVSSTFCRTQPPRGDGVCVYSISGGTGAHLADMCASAGLKLPRLTATTQQQLHEWIPAYLRVSNPVDSGGMPSADWRGGKILDVILADPKVDLVMCPITGALPSMGDRLAQRLVDAARSTNKPVFAIWGSPVGDEAAYRDILLPSGIPVFRTFANAVTAARAYFGYHDFRSRFRPSSLPSSVAARKSAAAKMARPFVRSDEDSSMAVLSAYGIAVPTHEVATSGAEAAKIAGRIGYPVVMKICSPTIPHKSDAGLVRVGVRNGREVKQVFSSFMARAPDADGVMISELVTGGVECVVGVARDELFGPVVMLGSGGVLIEVLRDVTFRVPPFSRRDAQEMIGEVTVARQLQRQGSDRAALVNVLMKVQRLALDLADEVVELDINPLLVRSMGLGAVALDALVVPGGRPC